MQLARYLELRGIRRQDFARLVDISPGWVTALCHGTGWPSREVAERIAQATEGAVTPNDFASLTSVTNETAA